MEPLERLLDLVQFLLSRRTPVTFTEIRERIPEAYGQGNLQSAKRMFERDKDVLREQGIPIETLGTDEIGGELGYLIDRKAYALPDVALTPEELGALMVVAEPASGDGAAVAAVRKLLAGMRGSPAIAAIGGVPRPAESRPANVDRALAAATDGRCVTFPYRAVDGDEAQRLVDAWAVVLRAGRWYLVGHDRDRGELRVFQIARMTGDVVDAGEATPRPSDLVAADHVGGSLVGAGPRIASVAFAPEVVQVAVAQTGARIVGADDGWPVVEVPFDDVVWFAAWILSFGDRAVAIAPEDLRAEIVRRLEAVAGG